MSKKDRIAALEALLAAAEKERDAARQQVSAARADRDEWHDAARRWKAKAESPSLVDQARGELERRWGWLLDLAGFGS